MTDDAVFHGAKLMLFLGPWMIVLRRDHTPGIAWPGRLDFPGGGREGGETAVACALRETREEVGLSLSEGDLVWRHRHARDGDCSWFFAAHQPATRVRDVQFGGEGTGWCLMPPKRFLTSDEAIPHFQDILRLYLAAKS